MSPSIAAKASPDVGRRVAAVLLLSFVAVAAGCGRKNEVSAAEPKSQAAANADRSVLDPKATIDHVKRTLDAAAEQDPKRRERIEEHMK